jgi:cyclase
MFRPRLIPVLSVKGKGLVKTIRFDKRNPRYIGDPINAVKIFNDLGTDELIFLDITATNENRCISSELIKSIGDEAYMPFGAGGGITTLEQIHKIISAGAEKVVISSAAINNPLLIRKSADKFGNQSIVVCIDIKKNLLGTPHVYINDGKTNTRLNPFDYAQKIESLGAGEIIINNIDRDGIMKGYDIELIKAISNMVNIPVVALGGGGNIDHFRDVFTLNGVSAAAGSYFIFHGTRNAVLVNYPDKEELKSIYTL